MTTPLSELRKLSTEELFDKLLGSDSDDRSIKDIIRTRMHSGTKVTFEDTNGSQPQQQPASAVRPKLTGDIALLAQEMKDAGYKGEGMYDPDTIMAYIDIAIEDNASSESLPTDAARRQWGATRAKFRIWQNKNARTG